MHLLSSPRFLLVLLGAATALARHVTVSWDVGYVVANRDGNETRTAIGVNGQFPIPPVHVTEGDVLSLHIHNSLNVTTAIHAHGLFQRGYNHMDGAAMVTQCGIPPGQSFTYEYPVLQPGTFWLHGHDHHQNADGLRTPLIVRDKEEPPYSYDGEHVLAFEDWFWNSFSSRLNETLDPQATFPPPSGFGFALINGINANHTKPIVFRPGQKYRIRLINMSATEWFKFAMPGHQMHVVEADGIYSEPYEVGGLTMGPGQRYSVLVTAHDRATYNYQYVVELFASFVPRIEGSSPRYFSGLVEYQSGVPLAERYAPQAVLDRIPEDISLAWASDVRLRALDRQPAFPVDRAIDLTLTGALFTDGVTRDVINNITYAQPLIPTLYSALTMGELAQQPEIYGPQTHALILRHNEYIELTVQNPNSIPHPMHMHGHAFQLIEYGPIDPIRYSWLNVTENVDPSALNVPPTRFSQWPMRRDTVVVPPWRYAKLRFRADNPGTWLFHCHMDIHFGMGMALTLVEGPEVLQKTAAIPEHMLDMCKSQGIGVSGNGAGNPGRDLGTLAAWVEIFWDIGYVEVNRDGYASRTAIGVNGKLPVPPVYVTEGDTLALHIHNSLNVTTAIHAHGLFQRGYNHMDGAAMVTQCGIPPGQSFTYEYPVTQPGTFWLHGHDHHQNVDGLRTPLIVRDKQAPYDYDGEHVLAFEDWYHVPFAARLKETLDPTGPFPPPATFPYALINGINGNYTEPIVFRPGKTYRIRLISLSTTEWFKFAMPGHQMHVVEADGIYSEPFPVDALTMGPGQRYSVLVTAHNSITYNYQFLVELFASFVPSIQGMSPRYYSGLVEYRRGAPLVSSQAKQALEEMPEDTSFAWASDVQLQALDKQPAFPVDRAMDLVLGGSLFTDGVTRDVINNITYAQPLIPTLYSALTMGDLAQQPQLYGPQTHALVLRHNEYIELTVHNPNRLPHPMHMHGHAFQLIEYGPVSTQLQPTQDDSQTAIPPTNPPPIRKFTKWPMRRDTVVVPIMQYVKLRFLLAPAVLCAHVFVDWDVGYVSVNRDGYNLRRAIGVNGRLPVPPIEATVGDTLELRVHNSLDKSTTIHAHGLFQRNATHMDGPAMANQCGIPPGKSFSYIYDIDQTGSFWLHGHDHHQNSDGLRGALIVYDQPDQAPYSYDGEILLTTEDWFKEEYAEREEQTLNPNKPFPPPHGYAFGMLNGRNGNDTEPWEFEPNKTYRLRLVNMASLMWFQFSMPGHKMQVIEVDGEYTEPLEVDGIDLAPAQRYSVLITTHEDDRLNYKYNATMHANFIPNRQGLTPRVYTGQITYNQNADEFDAEGWYESVDFKWLDDIELQAEDGAAELEPDRSLTYEIGSQLYSTGQRLDHFNNITFAAPKIPTLFTAMSMGEEAMDERAYGPQTHALVLHHNEVVELTINNPNAMPHPLHLHGHTFQIIEYGPAESRFPPPTKFQNLETRRFSGTPPRRDTMSIPEYSHITIRIKADNPGVWFLHCHLDIHFAMGMAMTIVEAPDVLQRTLEIPQEMYEFCRDLKIGTEGNGAGKRNFDFSGLPRPPVVVDDPNAGPLSIE
ncbi:ferroxidase fet3 [Coemansia sp. RSA 552]|nr:ferroxidase fet3 [Coemansia sp. RSA 552]